MQLTALDWAMVAVYAVITVGIGLGAGRWTKRRVFGMFRAEPSWPWWAQRRHWRWGWRTV